jgi:tRNA A-37 threonylcarbamoyl transferase component Bud32
MNWPFLRSKPTPQPLPHVVIKYVAATRAEDTEVRNRRASKEAELLSFLASRGVKTPEALRSAYGATAVLGRRG